MSDIYFNISPRTRNLMLSQIFKKQLDFFTNGVIYFAKKMPYQIKNINSGKIRLDWIDSKEKA